MKKQGKGPRLPILKMDLDSIFGLEVMTGWFDSPSNGGSEYRKRNLGPTRRFPLEAIGSRTGGTKEKK
jgi:hypothetical protein